jgi:two-component system sensor histidine kinase CpxA
MKSLFARIFFWFFAAQVLTGFAFYALAVWDPINQPAGQSALVRPSLPDTAPPRRPPHNPLQTLKSPRGLLRFFVMLAVMALVCYALARHITRPIARLREATQRLTDGDLSARVALGQSQDELFALGRDFDTMAARLQDGVEAQRRLLGDISHELRSPLARLSVALDLVEQGQARARSQGTPVPESTYVGAMERIRRESLRLNELIGRLLELARLEGLAAEEARRSSEVVHLDKVVGEVVADAGYEAHNRACSVELLENQPCSLRGVEALCHSAIENVVRNALRFTATGTAVEVTLRRDESKATPVGVITVRDHGPGVPPESLPHLFRPFYRVDTGRDRQSGGVGLGLSIAERALRVHNATIAAGNAPGGGLSVEIRIPIRPETGTERTATPAPA